MSGHMAGGVIFPMKNGFLNGTKMEALCNIMYKLVILQYVSYLCWFIGIEC